MARRSRGRSFKSGGKRYQWFGFQSVITIVDNGAVDSFIIIGATNTVHEQADVTVIRTIIQTGVARTIASAATGSLMAAVLQKTEVDAAGVPIAPLDPTSKDSFDLGDADAMGWWYPAVPTQTPLTAGVDLTFRTSEFQSRAKRRMKLRKHGLIVSYATDSSIDQSVTILARTLVQY